MSDTLYLSLWYPNLQLAALADKLTAVLGAFATHGGEARVYSAKVWPVSWSETPIFQQVYGRRSNRGQGPDATSELGAEPRIAVEEALSLLHDDYAYEFQIGWSLWTLEAASNLPAHGPERVNTDRGLDGRWVREPRLVRVAGYGPLFDE